MKKSIYSLCFAWLCCIAMVSCKSSQETATKALDDKMTTFFNALEKQDFETANTLVTPATQKLLTVVSEDAKKYKEFNDKTQPIKIEILERNVLETSADYKIRIFVGEKVKEQTIHCVYTATNWYLDITEEQLFICRYVVFYDFYDTILVLYKKKHTVIHETSNTTTTIIEVDRTHRKKTHKDKTHKKHKH